MATVTWHSAEVEARVHQIARSGLTVAGHALAADIKADLSHSGSGAEGSPAGTPPYERTGALAGAIGVTQRLDGVRVGVVDSSQMAKAVRLARGYTGTDARGAVRSDPPRPFIARALMANRARIVEHVARGG